MATKEFFQGNFKYSPKGDVHWNNEPAREWVRYEKRGDAWVRDGNTFVSRKATRKEIADTLAGIYTECELIRGNRHRTGRE